jgi:hypothetical protein
MSRIEAMLRDTLQERAAAPPAVEAMAERAIADAARIRRNRTASASIAAALSVVLVGIGFASYSNAPNTVQSDPPPGLSATWLPTTAITELSVNVVVDRYMYLAGGGVLSLASVVPASCDGGQCIWGVWRVSDGYLVSVHDAEATVGTTVLWHVPEFGSSSVVVDGGGPLVVGAGTEQRPGIQVVWIDDRRLHVGTYADGQAVEVLSTPSPVVEVAERSEIRALTPQAVVGDAVVLAANDADGDADLWDVWFPARGDYQPATYPLIGLQGTTVDGERIIGWHTPDDGQPHCLGELMPEEFEPVHSVCPSPFTKDARIHPSPDGRWWIVADRFRVAQGRVEPGLALYDAEQVWAGAGPVRTWTDPGSSFDGVWLDTETFAAIDRSSGTVATLYADGRPDVSLTLPTPGPTAKVSVVVDLR